MTRVRTIFAVCLILMGVITMVGPTFGFSSIAAERGTTVSTGSGADALVGLEPVGESINGRHDTATVARIHNNIGPQMTLTTSVDAGTELVIENGFESNVPAGGSTSLALACSGGGATGTQDVTITVNEANGTGIVVEGATMTVSVDYQCKGNSGGGNAGPASFEIDDVDGNGPTQRLRFDIGGLKNKEVATIDLSDAQQNASVNYADATATIVSGPSGRSFEFDKSTYEITYKDEGGSKGTLEIELTGFEITGDQSGTVSYTDTQGRSDDDTFSVPAVVSNGGNVTTDGDVVVPEGTAGEIDAGGNVQVGQNANVNGGITADGDVLMESGSTTSDSIDAGGSVVVEDTNVNGVITASGDVTLRSGTTVNGVDAGGTVTIESSVTINGPITAGGDVDVGDGINLPDVNSGGTVYIGCNVNENGEIDAENIVYDGVC